MTKWILVGCALLANLFAIQITRAEIYGVATAGAGGEAKASSFGVEGGWMGKTFIVGMGYAQITNGHTEYVSLVPPGAHRIDYYNDFYHKIYGNEAQIYWTLGMKVTTSLSVTTHCGFSVQGIDTDSAFGSYFQGLEGNTNACFGGQLLFSHGLVMLGGGFDNRRGFVGSFGLIF